MQIEVVDDYSTSDDPDAVVAEVGDGRVAFHRNPRNLGATETFNVCLEPRTRALGAHPPRGRLRAAGVLRGAGADRGRESRRWSWSIGKVVTIDEP